MRKILVVGAMVVSGLMLGGCSLLPQATEQNVDINVTLSGDLSGGTGGVYLLKTADGGVVSLHDGAVTLAEYLGRNITVTGQYSGTTLYVDKVVLK